MLKVKPRGLTDRAGGGEEEKETGQGDTVCPGPPPCFLYSLVSSFPLGQLAPWCRLPRSLCCFYFYCSGSTAEASNSKCLLLPRKIGHWQPQPLDRPRTKAAWPARLLTLAQGYGK